MSAFRPVRFFFALLVLGSLPAQSQEDPRDQIELLRSTLTALNDRVIPAYWAGIQHAFLVELAAVVDKIDLKEFEALEAYGRTQGIDSLRGTFAREVLSALEQGHKLKIDISKPDIAAFVLSEIHKRIAAEAAEVAQNPVMQEGLVLPPTWAERETLFWNAHVARNRFLNLNRLTGFVAEQAARQLKSKRNQNDPDRRKLFEELVALPSEIGASFRKLQNHEAMMRLDELLVAEDVLRHTMNFDDRLRAAYALEDDAHSLLAYLNSVPVAERGFVPLQKEGMQDEVIRLLKSGEGVGKDVIEKALLLRVGTHWWLRGRYGAGPLDAGLMKSPEAVTDPELMVGLYMPQQPDKPICDYFEPEQVFPGYDRRHDFTWAIERRDFRRA